MQEHTTSTAIPTNAIKAEALASMSASFERFCLAAGLEALAEMMEQDAQAASASEGGAREAQGESRPVERASCSNRKGCVKFRPAAPVSAFQHQAGHPPERSTCQIIRPPSSAQNVKPAKWDQRRKVFRHRQATN
jgi:hypothetical protein